MEVRHFESRDDKPDSLRLKGGHDCLADGAGHIHEVVLQVSIGIDPMIDFLSGNHQNVARSDRSNGQKRHGQLISPNEAAGYLAFDDLGK